MPKRRSKSTRKKAFASDSASGAAEQRLRDLEERLRASEDQFRFTDMGYSSLANLKRFPIDILKVDRSFIRELPRDAEDKAITEAIIAMGKTLSLTVVAEGVETEEPQTFLREHACDEMQGFFFSKPVLAADFAALLKHQK